MSEAIVKRLDYYLKKNGISLYRVAKDACVPISTLQNLYRGHTKSPTVSLMFKVTDALNVPFTEFFDCELFSAENVELD